MHTAFAPALWGLGRCVSDVLVAAASGSRAQRVQSMGLLRLAVSQNAPYSGGMMRHPRRMMWRSIHQHRAVGTERADGSRFGTRQQAHQKRDTIIHMGAGFPASSSVLERERGQGG